MSQLGIANSKSKHHTVLIIDDDEQFRTRLGRALAERGYFVQIADGVQSALATATACPLDSAVIDLKLRDDSGLTALEQLLVISPHLRAVVLTGYGTISTAIDAMRLGASDYLTKPASISQIVTALEQHHERGTAPPREAESFPTLSQVEWTYIDNVVQECEGNISRAARILGIHRRSLQRKIASRSWFPRK